MITLPPGMLAKNIAETNKLSHFFTDKLELIAIQATDLKEELLTTEADIYSTAEKLSRVCNHNIEEIHKFIQYTPETQISKLPSIKGHTGDLPNPVYLYAIKYAAYKTYILDKKQLKKLKHPAQENPIAHQNNLSHFFTKKLELIAIQSTDLKEEVLRTEADLYSTAEKLSRACQHNIEEIHKFVKFTEETQIERIPSIKGHTGDLPNPVYLYAIMYAAYKTHILEKKRLKKLKHPAKEKTALKV